MTFTCTGCRKVLDSFCFYVKHRNKTPTRRSDWCSRCNECTKAWKQMFYAKNAERINTSHKLYRQNNHEECLRKEAARRISKSETPERVLHRRTIQELSEIDRYLNTRLVQWRSSAKKRGLPFDLTLDKIKKLLHLQQGKCFYTGDQIDLFANSKMTLSLDRVDSMLGYTSDNVVACGRAVNLMKSDLNINDFCDIIMKIYNKKYRDGV